MPTSLTLDTARCNDGNVVLVAAGEIDLSNIDAFDQALSAATTDATNSGGRFTVDLSAVEYLDSAAINALFARADHIHVIAHPLLMSILRMSGLTELVPIDVAPQTAEL
ncbi:anti-anti-sigma factor [Mycobacterium kubicae]|uniref:Anti-anti-sigma factor n=1 Tax=Mycobacterium kubicae TaxID=120959 RepID=A0AAX1J737_9MYCO|nr:STAS domain-containing protein [Mycobacterium kubicae]MCV7097460.1 STAS domain-containing protein [Mycobacterium kubicae]OBF21453.1 anti-anti-sigma factor [Mycobacterium kubicae]OBK49157.1 anti-anti-sigma factor [Mycobacterium kubicae]ORV96492.1 anti-anti-sigma factor [Mycobacterium kubicae]QNI07642.1 STAS domain-containing protein [Mycobacterium kubicae]